MVSFDLCISPHSAGRMQVEPSGLLVAVVTADSSLVSSGMKGRESWDANDYDWDPHTLEGAARPRRSAATRPREPDDEDVEEYRPQRRQSFVG